MIAVLTIFVGALIAALLDWAIYTHLSAYLRAGFRLDHPLNFADLLITKRQKGRFALVIGSGIVAGVAFADPNPTLWLISLTIFL